ncbi:hypothetical protein DPMN_138121 [Dreissena polymorpha]|uniref:Uncharacterized protein n=1 Tax=Dreissena polymorpha TaxID=45954 RepID=A0A9D4G614_DREPO|nr:hypothetical protein DPMN_138121 [Dreissena polymorpha]
MTAVASLEKKITNFVKTIGTAQRHSHRSYGGNTLPKCQWSRGETLTTEGLNAENEFRSAIHNHHNTRVLRRFTGDCAIVRNKYCTIKVSDNNRSKF